MPSAATVWPQDYSRETPEWLREFDVSRPQDFPWRDFWTSRVVFYPGSGLDRHALEVFGSSGVASCFVNVDLTASPHEVRAAIEGAGFLAGYKPVLVADLREPDLAPAGWTPHFRPPVSYDRWVRPPEGGAFGILAVLQRRPGHGAVDLPERLAFVHVGGEAVAAFDALFCQGGRAPFGIVLQDHGFGGNWTVFGDPLGPFLTLAHDAEALPEVLLVADNTRAWPGYERIAGPLVPRSAEHAHERWIWRRTAA